MRVFAIAVAACCAMGLTTVAFGQKQNDGASNKDNGAYAYFTKDRKNIICRDEAFLREVKKTTFRTEYSDDLTYEQYLELLYATRYCDCENKVKMPEDVIDFLNSEYKYYCLKASGIQPKKGRKQKKFQFLKNKTKQVIEYITSQNKLSIPELERIALHEIKLDNDRYDKNRVDDQVKCYWHAEMLSNKGYVRSLAVTGSWLISSRSYVMRALEKDSQQKGIAKLILAGSKGEYWSYYILGSFFWERKSNEIDEIDEIAISCFRLAANLGNIPAAMYYLSHILRRSRLALGVGGEKYIHDEMMWCKRAADSGYLLAMLHYIKLCLEETDNKDIDIPEAEKYLIKAKKFIEKNKDNLYVLYGYTEYVYLDSPITYYPYLGEKLRVVLICEELETLIAKTKKGGKMN